MKKIIIAIVLLVIVGFVAYNYIYQDHRDIQEEIAVYNMSSANIHQDFLEDLSNSESKYLDQTIEIKGVVTEINDSDLTLDDRIFCTFDKLELTKLGDNITIKGRCIGFDDLLELVKLDQCKVLD